MRFTILLSSLLLLIIPLSAAAANFVSAEKPIDATDKQEFDYDVALKTSQSAIGKQLANHAFINAEGKQVTLEDFRGKPLVISMVYTSCYQICPMTTRHLSKVIEKARDAMGEDSFAVAVIGFDTRVDTPDAMQYFANKQGISDKNWNLLSIAEEDLAVLSAELGFHAGRVPLVVHLHYRRTAAPTPWLRRAPLGAAPQLPLWAGFRQP